MMGPTQPLQLSTVQLMCSVRCHCTQICKGVHCQCLSVYDHSTSMLKWLNLKKNSGMWKWHAPSRKLLWSILGNKTKWARSRLRPLRVTRTLLMLLNVKYQASEVTIYFFSVFFFINLSKQGEQQLSPCCRETLAESLFDDCKVIWHNIGVYVDILFTDRVRGDMNPEPAWIWAGSTFFLKKLSFWPMIVFKFWWLVWVLVLRSGPCAV